MSESSDSVRSRYEALGATEYYRQQGADYRNPHEPVVRKSIAAAVERWRPDLTRVLDLAAGSGEATLALLDAGAALIDATDPYTHEACRRRTGRAAERLAFADVAAGALAGRHYTLVACSFALHLCEPSRLPAVCQQLALVADALLILTPHKRPLLRPEWGWRLEGEMVIERVRSRFYRSGAVDAL